MRQELEELARILDMTLAEKFTEQGHNLSGAGVDSIETEVIEAGAIGYIMRTFMEGYMIVQDQGIQAQRIPFGRGGGTTSQFIEGLKNFALKRGMARNDKEATSVAFAIAKKMKQRDNPPFGMPTRNALSFSRTGKRTGFIDVALEAIQGQFDRLIEDETVKTIDVIINKR